MATVMAKWGKKKWKVTRKKLNPIGEMNYSMSYNEKEKKKEPRIVKVPYTVYQEFGVNVRKELNSWYKLLGTSNALYIGAKRFGPKKLMLTSVDITEIKATESGIVRSATISLTLEEPS